MNKVLEKKLKRERVEACLNCKKFVECVDFEEVEGEAWVIKKLVE
jgi:hypothetical protein